jgi:hypothetical protein
MEEEKTNLDKILEVVKKFDVKINEETTKNLSEKLPDLLSQYLKFKYFEEKISDFTWIVSLIIVGAFLVKIFS